MESPRSGLRRARVVSWALAGLGVAAVAGTSTLAYADTFKPRTSEAPIVAVQPAPPEQAPRPALDAPESPRAVTIVTDSPILGPAPEPTVAQTPATHESTLPEYTPEYTPPETYAPNPITPKVQAPSSTPPTTKRRNLTPSTVMAPNYSPHVAVSRGS